jgi:hypothetical protein
MKAQRIQQRALLEPSGWADARDIAQRAEAREWAKERTQVNSWTGERDIEQWYLSLSAETRKDLEDIRAAFAQVLAQGKETKNYNQPCNTTLLLAEIV